MSNNNVKIIDKRCQKANTCLRCEGWGGLDEISVNICMSGKYKM